MKWFTPKWLHVVRHFNRCNFNRSHFQPKPKLTKTKIPKDEKFWTKIWTFEFLLKAKFKNLDGHEQQIIKIDNSKICKANFLSAYEIPIKLKYHNKKQPNWVFAPYNFLKWFFFDTPLHEPKISENGKDYFWFSFVNGVAVFSEGEISVNQRSLVYNIWEAGTTNIRIWRIGFH